MTRRAPRRSGVRFRPPRVEARPALLWVLARAFGPPAKLLATIAAPGGAALQAPVADAYSLAAGLGLSPRIAARVSPGELIAEVGAEQAALFRRDRLSTAASNLRLAAVAEELARVASALGLPIVFLKFFALELAGVLAEGSRPAADLDVLVAPERAEELHRALVESGFAAAAMPGMEHQLPALLAPQGGPVEIHRIVLGVRLAVGEGSATAPGLAAAGLLVPARGLAGPCFVPAREVLAAHALVHGLVQHGLAPHAYPALRLIGDWLDLCAANLCTASLCTADLCTPHGGAPEAGAAEARDQAGAGWLARVARLVAGEISEPEVSSLAGLGRRLGAGDLAVLAEPIAESGETALLHHLLAGALDERYGRSLRFAMLARPLSDRSRPVAVARSLWKALFPSRAELEAIYGPARGARARWARRLGRPLDLARRAFAYAASAVALRRSSHVERPGQRRSG